MKYFFIILFVVSSTQIYSQDIEDYKTVASINSIDELINVTNYIIDSSINTHNLCIEYSYYDLENFESN